MKLGINGFGRIGRAIFKINQKHDFFDVIGINDIDDAENMSYLLKYDSTYGRYEDDITTSSGVLCVGEKRIKHTNSPELENVEWVDEVDVIIDATGISDNVKKLKRLIEDGRIKKAVITHCSGDVDKTIIMGANESEYDDSRHDLVSSSICDANAVAQVLKIVNENWKIKSCMLTTLHPWLSYQNLVDGTVASISNPGNVWKDFSLGRSAVNNLIPKNTTAAKAVLEVLPELKGKLDAMSFRIPTDVVTCSDITIFCEEDVTPEEALKVFEESQNNFLTVNKESKVSVDYKMTEHSAILDAQWIKVLNNNVLKLVVWYDNEWAYACRALDVARMVTGE
jgi:glyceraldehyde 3-phosphate dehydrogenase